MVLVLMYLLEWVWWTRGMRVCARPVSDRDICLNIRDLGFGEIVPASGKTWEHVIHLQ